MKIDFLPGGAIQSIHAEHFCVPFVADNYGFFVEQREKQNPVVLMEEDGGNRPWEGLYT